MIKSTKYSYNKCQKECKACDENNDACQKL